MWLWSHVLTVRKGCLVFCNTLLSVTVWATSSCSKHTLHSLRDFFLHQQMQYRNPLFHIKHLKKNFHSTSKGKPWKCMIFLKCPATGNVCIDRKTRGFLADSLTVWCQYYYLMLQSRGRSLPWLWWLLCGVFSWHSVLLWPSPWQEWPFQKSPYQAVSGTQSRSLSERDERPWCQIYEKFYY